jgi:hypothetical protein
VRSPALLVPALLVVLPAQGAPAAMTDADAQALARKALGMSNPEETREALRRLRVHRFKSSLAKEREYVLYAQGILEDRLGETGRAALTFRKLERTWPASIYLPEAQITLASAALDRKRYQEAETRLKKALQSEIPIENKRKAQELLLWILVEQDRALEGLPILKSLFPHASNEKPSERGLVALVDVLCLAKEREQAESTRKDLHSLYPNSSMGPRVDLACARLAGTLGDAKGAAELFRTIITEKPGAAEADEARLALATLLSEGKLQPKELEGLPSIQGLLDEMKNTERKGDLLRRKLLVQLRLLMNERRWKEAVDTATKLRSQEPSKDQTLLATRLRAESFQAWAQQALDARQASPLLPYLDREGIESLSSPQRLLLVRQLCQGGLSGAAQPVIAQAPAKEKEALRKAALESLIPGTQAEETLSLLPTQRETPLEALRRAQALVNLHRWSEARNPLSRATPGEERISTLLAYLRRPQSKGETAASRIQEATSFLTQAREKGAAREPLAILVADLRAKAGDWRGALLLYPETSLPEHRGWVALMRATCQTKLGRKDAAREILKAAMDAPGFKMERETLAKQLGM